MSHHWVKFHLILYLASGAPPFHPINRCQIHHVIWQESKAPQKLTIIMSLCVSAKMRISLPTTLYTMTLANQRMSCRILTGLYLALVIPISSPPS